MPQITDKRAHWQALLTSDDLSPLTRFLNFELIEFDVEEGWCEAYFTLPPEAANPGGHAQGGMITAMLDDVMSVAGSVVQPAPAMSPTLQMTTSFLRPVRIGERLQARGEVVRKGRAAIHTAGWLKDADGRLLATATASCIPRTMR